MSAAGGDLYYDVNPMFLKYFGDLYKKLGPRSGGVFSMLYYPHATDEQRYLVISRMAQMAKESKVPQITSG